MAREVPDKVQAGTGARSSTRAGRLSSLRAKEGDGGDGIKRIAAELEALQLLVPDENGKPGNRPGPWRMTSVKPWGRT